MLSDTARLLRTRGRAMQEASPVGEGAMSALLGIEMNLVEEACKEASDVGVVVVANDNAPGQIVISGAAKAVERAAEIAKKKGAKRAIPLNVSTPNHSPATVEQQLTQHRSDDADDANGGDDGEGMPQEAEAPRHHDVRGHDRQHQCQLDERRERGLRSHLRSGAEYQSRSASE